MGDLISSIFSGRSGGDAIFASLGRPVNGRVSGRRNIGQPAGLNLASSAITTADERTTAEDRARRRAGEVVPTRNQGAVAASVNTPGEVQRLRDSLNAGGVTPRSKLTLEEQQKIIARKKKERGERESSERGATLSRAAAGALQSLFTRDTDIPEEVFSATTLGKQVVLGGGLRA